MTLKFLEHIRGERAFNTFVNLTGGSQTVSIGTDLYRLTFVLLNQIDEFLSFETLAWVSVAYSVELHSLVTMMMDNIVMVVL